MAVWPSTAIEKTWLFFVGMVVLRMINFVMMAAESFNAERELGDVEEEDVGDIGWRGHRPGWTRRSQRPRRER